MTDRPPPSVLEHVQYHETIEANMKEYVMKGVNSGFDFLFVRRTSNTASKTTLEERV